MGNHSSGSAGSADDLYSADHTPDPVTKDAVAAAMRATDHPEKHPVLRFLGVILIVIIAAASTYATIYTAVNTSKVREDQITVKKQAECLGSLLSKFEQDQLNRAQIASDDRNVVRNLISDLVNAKSQADKQKALDTYNAANVANDARRAKIPLTLKPDCNLPGVSVAPVAPGSATLAPVKPSASASKTPGAAGSTGTAGSGSTKGTTSNAAGGVGPGKGSNAGTVTGGGSGGGTSTGGGAPAPSSSPGPVPSGSPSQPANPQPTHTPILQVPILCSGNPLISVCLK